MKNKRSVQTTLQYVFFLLITLIFLAYISYFVISESRKIKSGAFEAISTDAATAAEFTDDEIRNINTVMQNVVYSNLVKEHFLTYLDKKPSGDDAYSSMQNISVLCDLLTAIIGPSRPVDQIYLYSLEEGYVGVGLDNRTSADPVKDMAWYGDLMASEGNRIIFCDSDDRLKKYYSYSEGSRFLSVCSVYQSNFYKPQGVIEVKHSISSLTKRIRKVDTGIYNEKIYIFDTGGNAIYAPEGSGDLRTLFEAASSADIAEDSPHHLMYGKDQHLFVQKSSYSGFTTVIATGNKDLYRPMVDYVKANILIFFVFVILVLILSYVVSKIITIPIMKMYSGISGMYTKEEDVLSGSLERIDTNIIELDTLYNAVVDMHDRAQASMNREISLNRLRLQSEILALQSQMNPHFLYNSLATISAMADEGMNSEVTRMCQTMSRILRYISSNKEPLVSIRDDCAHARDYLECMKMRYGDDLVYEIDIPDKMQDMMIPKLCLQLIVENSIKYATKSVKPPWKIRISGKCTGIYWEIAVSDNGPGFTPEDIKELDRKIEEVNATDLLPDLEINGMGLMNIYIRFRTLYKGKHIFRVSNDAAGGAVVTIGGEYETKDDEAAPEDVSADQR